jgi:hypothetical protein
MVTDKKIKSLDFDTLDEYFEYILDSRTNGNKQQARELYKDLSPSQKLAFNNWFCSFTFYDREEETESEALNNMLNYLNS